MKTLMKAPAKKPRLRRGGVKKFEFKFKFDLKKLLLWFLVGWIALSFLFSLTSQVSEKEEIPLSQALADIKTDKVERVEIEDNRLNLIYKDDTEFVSRKEPDVSFTEILGSAGIEAAGVDILIKDTSISKAWLNILGTLLPLGLMGLFLFFIFKQARGAQDSIFSFGRSRARLFAKGKQQVSFQDVAGVREAKEELEEVVDFLKNPAKYRKLGARTPKGVLLIGPSGTGKTLLAKALAGEANVPFFSMAGSEFMEMLVGVGASVTGDTPVLIKKDGKVELLPIGEFVDQYYRAKEVDKIKKVMGVETLGFQKAENKFWGTKSKKSEKAVFERSSWQSVQGVYRHKVKKIYEISFLGGKIQTTGDHSVFVRTHGWILPKKVAELKAGDVLVNLPMNVRRWDKEQRKTIHKIKKCYVKKVIKKPFNGFVYDLCGVENEAFFGGEKPILLHNSRVRDLFSTAKKASPAIIFIDEVESIGRHRGLGGFAGGHGEQEQTLNQILVEMDGFTPNDNVIILAATNRPDMLDPALMRPGRFDRTIALDMPDIEDRKAILAIHARGKPFVKNLDWDKVSHRTVGFSGADLENMLNEAAILAARGARKAINMEDVEEAATKVKLGPEKKRLQTKEERRMTAYHEAGHAVVSYNLPQMDPVHRVSIVSRGLAMGYTMIPPKKDRYTETQSHLLETIVALLGGRAAEQLIFNEFTGGAASDIDQATRIARRMVVDFGMSKLGPTYLGPQIETTEYGRNFIQPTEVSPEMQAKVDAEIKRIADESYQQALEILKKNKRKLDLVAEKLVEQETIDGDEFQKLMKPKISKK